MIQLQLFSDLSRVIVKSCNYPRPTMGMLAGTIVRLLPFAPKFIVSWVAKRYVAGESLEQALSVISRISVEGSCFTIDVLGEEVRTMEETVFFEEAVSYTHLTLPTKA